MKLHDIVLSVEKIRKENHITDTEKKRLCEIHLCCRKNQWIHKRCSTFFYKCNHGLSIPAIVVNSVMAVITQIIPEQTIVYTSIFVLNTMLELFRKYFMFEKKFQEHLYISNQFEQLATEIENLIAQLNINQEQYKNLCNKFSSMVSMDNVYVPDTISEEAKNKFKRFSDIEKCSEENREV